MDNVDKMLRSHGAMLGRMLIGLLFVFTGVGVLIGGIGGFAGMIAMADLPFPMLLAWLAVIVKIGGGAALILGWRTEQAALALVVFTLLTTVFFHLNLEDVNLFKNLAIVGGLFYVYVYGPGNGWKLKM